MAADTIQHFCTSTVYQKSLFRSYVGSLKHCRVQTLGQPLSASVLKAITPHSNVVTENFKNISRDLQGPNFYRYQRSISGGTQEFVEALSFQHYLETQSLITLESVGIKLQSFATEGDTLSITPSDFVLGLFDMTGELMRFAITTMATVGALPGGTISQDPPSTAGEQEQSRQRHVLHDLQELRARLEVLNTDFHQYDKKLEVTQASVDKVEKALYGLVVRGSERPSGWVPDILDARGGRGEIEAT